MSSSAFPSRALRNKTAPSQRLLLEKTDQPPPDGRFIHKPSANTLPQHGLYRPFHPRRNHQPFGHSILHSVTRLQGGALLGPLSTVPHLLTNHTPQRLKTRIHAGQLFRAS